MQENENSWADSPSFSVTCSLASSIFVRFPIPCRTAFSANLGETVDSSLPSSARPLAISEEIPSPTETEIDKSSDGVGVGARRSVVEVSVEFGLDVEPPVLERVEDAGLVLVFLQKAA